MSGRLTVIGGGARSGKSRFAEQLARARGSRRLFLATAEASDDEMRARIEQHIRDRGDEFRTREVPRELAAAVADSRADEVVLIDCLTLWLSNLLCDGLSGPVVEERVAELVGALTERSGETIVVTNEVGLGIVPTSALGRLFRDIAGRAHQRLAAAADELYLGAMGAMIRLKPAPIEALFGSFAPPS